MAEQGSSSQKLASNDLCTGVCNRPAVNNRKIELKIKKNVRKKAQLHLTTQMPPEELTAETIARGSGQNTFLPLWEFSWRDQSGQWFFTGCPTPGWTELPPCSPTGFMCSFTPPHAGATRQLALTLHVELYRSAHACRLAGPLWFSLFSPEV